MRLLRLRVVFQMILLAVVSLLLFFYSLSFLLCHWWGTLYLTVFTYDILCLYAFLLWVLSVLIEIFYFQCLLSISTHNPHWFRYQYTLNTCILHAILTLLLYVFHANNHGNVSSMILHQVPWKKQVRSTTPWVIGRPPYRVDGLADHPIRDMARSLPTNAFFVFVFCTFGTYVEQMS